MFHLIALVSLLDSSLAANPGQQWPTFRPGKIISTPDWSDYRIYPKAARKKEQEGKVVPELLVGADGRPEACRILKTSSFAELDAGTCKLMMQMRFEPARDASGIPIQSRFSEPVNWSLTDPRPFASSSLTSRVSIEGGKLRNCEVVGGNGPYVSFWSNYACSVFADLPYYFDGKSDQTIDATIDVRLDAGDRAPFLDDPIRAGVLLASETVEFTINRSGDASSCTPVETHGFGRRGLNSLSPCGPLLSKLWFKDAPRGSPVRRGKIETRVFAVRAGD